MRGGRRSNWTQLVSRAFTPRMLLSVRRMAVRHGARHVVSSKRIERTTVARLTDACGRWTISALGMSLRGLAGGHC